MTEFLARPSTTGLVRISGKICNYRAKRESASFIFTESDQTTFGVIAVAASLAGLGAQAMSVASNTTSMEEEADHVSFEIDGSVVSGWLWRSPFKEGDHLEIAAEWRSDHYELLGAARPSDRTIALYPHCSRSKKKHILNAVKWWIYISIFFELGMISISGTYESITMVDYWKETLTEGGFRWVLLGIHVFIGIAIYSMACKWLPFTKVAEKVFRSLGLSNPDSIDLVRSSKGKSTINDSFEYGAMYFRY